MLLAGAVMMNAVQTSSIVMVTKSVFATIIFGQAEKGNALIWMVI
jgi:hypothetical protein